MLLAGVEQVRRHERDQVDPALRHLADRLLGPNVVPSRKGEERLLFGNTNPCRPRTEHGRDHARAYDESEVPSKHQSSSKTTTIRRVRQETGGRVPPSAREARGLTTRRTR